MVRLILGKGKCGQSHGEHPAVQTPKCETWGRVEGNRIMHRVFASRVFNDHTRIELLVPYAKRKHYSTKDIGIRTMGKID
ncbi:hypothetical protein PUN28_007942 [Cardiocondyla obscurior]|uniref:Uncharacterized protein n=1 Tax=Cardiocondyla obscurior TaxID=286306 RepID=A0AAW2FVP1_9HYME